MDLVVGGHQGQTFALSEPRIRGTQPSRNGHALNAPRALRPNGHQRRVREKSCHEPVDLRRREARAREGGRDLDAEDRGDDDRIDALQERRQIRDRGCVKWLAGTEGRDGDRRVEHVLHRRPCTRSSAAGKFGSPQCAASSKNARTASSFIASACRLFGAATSTGTMAAAGLPWRKITMRFFLCSAWSTSSDRCALASASEVLITRTIMTKLSGQRTYVPTILRSSQTRRESAETSRL
jgi:hypothetical protein